jgi:uncharacterized membrane protein
MGAVLIVVGLSVGLAGIAADFPYSLGGLGVGIVLVGLGAVLIRHGLRLRPHSSATK